MKTLTQLPPSQCLESTEVLKQLNTAHRYLGELKGKCEAMPNQEILIHTLPLQEAQDSSHIENIITTQDEILKHKLSPKIHTPATKEVANYNEALYSLFIALHENQNLLTSNMIIKAQKIIKGNEAGLRTQEGTVLKNEQTGEIIYEPPSPNQINTLLGDLEAFINNMSHNNLDPITKMAIIHHQFESIHPFYDGNGRIGRIINIIYLIKENLLNIPVLYLSRYINHNKEIYYQLLQQVRETEDWQPWLLYMANAVTQTAKSTIETVENIKQLQQRYKQQIRRDHSKIYSQDLINNLFEHPYTNVTFLQKDLQVSYPTATRYLNTLTQSGLLSKHKLGKANYYTNHELVAILTQYTSLKED